MQARVDEIIIDGRRYVYPPEVATSTVEDDKEATLTTQLLPTQTTAPDENL